MTATRWADAIATYADHLADAGRTDATAEVYLRHVRHLADAFPNTEPADLTSARIAEWLTGRSWSTSTRRQHIGSWRGFYRMLIANGCASRSPIAGLPVRHQPPGPPPTSPRYRAWAAAIDAYLIALRAGGRAPGTVQQRRYGLLDLADLHPDPWTITTDDLAAWIGRPDMSPEYRRSRRAIARGFYSWARKTGRVDHNPAADLAPVRLPRALPRPITDPALLDALHKADERQQVILYLAALAGLRRGEIARLRWDDWAGGQITVHGKGGHMRRVPVHPDLADALTTYRTRHDEDPSGYLFPSTTYPGRPLEPASLGVIIRDVLPAGTTLHQLRHRFATAAYAVDRDLRAVQELLGHAKIETTTVYTAVPADALTSAVAAVGIHA